MKVSVNTRTVHSVVASIVEGDVPYGMICEAKRVNEVNRDPQLLRFRMERVEANPAKLFWMHPEMKTKK